MKGKVKHIVGIVISALVLPVSGYGTFLFTVALALAVGLNEEGFNGDAGKLLAMLLAAIIVSVTALTFLILCSVKLAKINKQAKLNSAVQAEVEQPTQTEEIEQPAQTEE